LTNAVTRPERTSRRRAAGFAIGIVAVLSLAACTGDDDGEGAAPEPTEAPAPEPTEAPAPEPTEAPAPEPTQAPAQPQSTSPQDSQSTDGLTDEEWVLLIILGIGAIALIIGVTSMASNHSDKKRAQESADRRRVGEIVGLGRWLVDQGSIDVLRATDTHSLQTSWASVRQRAVEIETRSRSLASSLSDTDLSDALTKLSNDTAALRGVLETGVTLRTDQQADPDANQVLINDNTSAVYQRRQDVQMDLNHLSSAQV